MKSRESLNVQATHLDVSLDHHFPINFVVFSGNGTASALDSTSLHFHNCMEFYLPHTTTEYVIFGDERIHLRVGDIVLVYPHVPHASTINFSNPDEALGKSCDILFIDPLPLLNCIDSLPGDIAPPKHDAFRSNYRVFNKETHSDIYNTIVNIQKEFTLKKYGWRFSVMMNALILLAYIERAQGAHKTTPSRRENTIEIKPALNYINHNYSEHIYLTLLSELCHMSQATFRRKFKEIMGTTPLDYIHDIRIQRACVLLRGSKMSITEISLNVGFESISSFNRKFLSIKGITPNQYRSILPESELAETPID